MQAKHFLCVSRFTLVANATLIRHSNVINCKLLFQLLRKTKIGLNGSAHTIIDERKRKVCFLGCITKHTKHKTISTLDHTSVMSRLPSRLTQKQPITLEGIQAFTDAAFWHRCSAGTPTASECGGSL